MTATTRLSIGDKLPLTCSRSGTCCHGKNVQLNPWELASLSKAKKSTPREFRDLYCEFGGIRLRFDGEPGWKGLLACSQYIAGVGCSVHFGRPLACRLYPLGRQKQAEETHYMYEGNKFPCMEGCPEVRDLPQLSIAEYIKGQIANSFEKAQDEYLEVMQNLADGAFVLLLETGLSKSGDRKTLRLWKKMGRENSEQLAERIGPEWTDRLMLPELSGDLSNPVTFVNRHNDLLQSNAQELFSALEKNQDWHEASCLMLGLALYLGFGLGADQVGLSEHWIATAKKHGALD
jgi:Fe-S-cluster containining protein